MQKSIFMQDKNAHRAEMFEMIEQWQKSGLSQKDFCVSKDVAYHSFHYWYRVYKSAQNTGVSFVPVNITSPANQDQIVLTSGSGIQVLLPFTNQSVLLIKQLLIS